MATFKIAVGLVLVLVVSQLKAIEDKITFPIEDPAKPTTVSKIQEIISATHIQKIGKASDKTTTTKIATNTGQILPQPESFPNKNSEFPQILPQNQLPFQPSTIEASNPLQNVSPSMKNPINVEHSVVEKPVLQDKFQNVSSSKPFDFNIYLTKPDAQSTYQGVTASTRPTVENLALEAIFNMGPRLQSLWFNSQSNENFVVSPLSATILIGELMIAADGPFLKELYGLLSLPYEDHRNKLILNDGQNNVTIDLPYSTFHYQLINLLRVLTDPNSNRNFTLNSANELFYNHKEILLLDYVQKLKLYDGKAFALNFEDDAAGSTDYINDLLEYQTNGFIKKFFSYPLPSTTKAVFANVLYFKANWKDGFNYRFNTQGTFKVNKNKIVNVTYMSENFEDVLYTRNEKLRCRMIAFPYKNNELKLYVILPTDDEYDVKDFVNRVQTDDILRMIDDMQENALFISMPKISITSTLHMLKPLRLLSKQQTNENRNNSILDQKPNTSGGKSQLPPPEAIQSDDIFLTKAAEGPFRVNDMIQKVKLIIDEKGTEAGVVSAAVTDRIGARNFFIDRPFTFFIRHEQTGTILFWGTIVDPTQSS